MYKRILVAVDGSSTAERGLQQALGLAKETNAQVLILHVVDEATSWDPNYMGPAGAWDAFVQEGRAVLDKAAAVAAAAGVPAQTRMVENVTFGRRVEEVIAEEAQAWTADLIVAGTHGRRGPSRLFLGSVAERIARVTGKPVLLVRDEAGMPDLARAA